MGLEKNRRQETLGTPFYVQVHKILSKNYYYTKLYNVKLHGYSYTIYTSIPSQS